MRHRLSELRDFVALYIAVTATLFPAYLVTIMYIWFYADEQASKYEPYVPKYKRPFFTRAALRMVKWIETWLVPPWKCFCYRIQTMKSYRSKYKHKHKCAKTSRGCNNCDQTKNERESDRKQSTPMAYVFQSDDENDESDLRPRTVKFDTDSKLIRIDNCASKCISPHIGDFVGETRPTSRRVKGIGGTIVKGIRVGTIKWSIEDDEGKVHNLILPDSYFVPTSPSRLLSPQHWAQQAKDNKPTPRGTWCATYHDEIVLFWNQRKSK